MTDWYRREKNAARSRQNMREYARKEAEIAAQAASEERKSMHVPDPKPPEEEAPAPSPDGDGDNSDPGEGDTAAE